MSFRKFVARRLTFANCAALAAVFIALGGVAFAASLPRNSVTSKQIKDSSVESRDLKNGSIAGADLKDGNLTSADYGDRTVQGVDIKDGTVTGTDVDESTLTAVPSVTGMHPIARKAVTATDGANLAAALAAAPETPLITVGEISIVAKCYRDVSVDEVYATPYIKTTVNGAIFESNSDSKRGGPLVTDYLQTDTLEADRELEDIAGLANDTATFSGDDNTVFSAMTAAGSTLTGNLMVGARNGAAPTGVPISVEHGCVFGGVLFSA